MRILWDDTILEIKTFNIREHGGKIKVEYWENYYEANKEGGCDFYIDKTCFKNGEKDFKAFIEVVKISLLEKGFFDFDQDYLVQKLNKGGK